MRFRLSSINPFTSLFGKIFIWFWLTIILMLITAFFIGKLVNDNHQISLADPLIVQSQQQTANSLQMLVERGVPIQRALRRANTRAYPLSTIVNEDQKEIKISFPEPLIRESKAIYRKRIFELSKSSEVLMIRTPTLEVIGPLQLEGELSEYKLFTARVLRRNEQVERNRLPVLLLILFVGTLLCASLAWRLSKPLKQLMEATKQISSGDLNTQLHGYENRRDEIGQLAKDFNQMSTKLAHSIEQQQRLMANISHELRTPLTRLQLASAILEESSESETTKKNVCRIEQEIKVMDELIGQAIDLARMSLGQLSNASTPEFDSYQLVKIMEEFEGTLALEAEAVSKRITFKKIPDIKVSVHLQTFISSLENIVRNALRYAKESVLIEVEVHNEDVHIYVSDDGVGATENAFMEFLKPFNYARQQNQNHHSYGLGLAIADAGIKIHQGSISWSSPRLGGLTVLITIPIK